MKRCAEPNTADIVNAADNIAVELGMINELPGEVLQVIFSHLPLSTLVSLSAVSVRWRSLVHPLFQDLIERYYPHLKTTQLQAFINTPVTLFATACHDTKQKYSNSQNEGQNIAFELVLAALSGSREVIIDTLSLETKTTLYALLCVNGHALPANLDNITYRSIIHQALHIAAENGCPQAMFGIKKLYDASNDLLIFMNEQQRQDLLCIAARKGHIALVKTMFSWPGDVGPFKNCLNFLGVEKGNAVVEAVKNDKFEVAKYLCQKFGSSSTKKIEEILVEPTLNIKFVSFFQTLSKRQKLRLLANASDINNWLILLDENDPQMQVAVLKQAIAQGDHSLAQKYNLRYKPTEVEILMGFKGAPTLGIEMLKIFLGNLSIKNQGYLILKTMYKREETETFKFLFSMPEIPQQFKSQAFKELLEFNDYAHADSPVQERIQWIRKEAAPWNKGLQLLMLVASGSLEELQAFINEHSNLSQEEVESALELARIKRKVEFTQYLSGVLGIAPVDNDYTEDERHIHMFKFGLLSHELKSIICKEMESASLLSVKSILPYMQNHLEELFIGLATSVNLEVLKFLVDFPEISDKCKAMALKKAIQFGDAKELDIITFLLTTNGITSADKEEALQIAKEEGLDAVVTLLEEHISREKLMLTENSAVYTPAMAASANQNNSTPTQQERMMIEEPITNKSSLKG